MSNKACLCIPAMLSSSLVIGNIIMTQMFHCGPVFFLDASLQLVIHSNVDSFLFIFSGHYRIFPVSTILLKVKLQIEPVHYPALLT